MSENSKIEWTDATWNPVVARRLDTGKIGYHCEKVSPACTHCYAETFNGRNLPARGTGLDYTKANRERVAIELHADTMEKPLHWRKPRKVFVCSMTDLFGEFVPFESIDRIVAVMSVCNRHTFQVLTKRPDRAARYFADRSIGDILADLRHEIECMGAGQPAPRWLSTFVGMFCLDDTFNGTRPAWNGEYRELSGRRLMPEKWPLPNVWIGTTVEDQQRANERIPHLLQCPAAVRFVSYEPALGPVDFDRWLLRSEWQEAKSRVERDKLRMVDPSLHWIICGGESGPGARPMHPDWARSVRDQCAAAGVPFLFKQWGEWTDYHHAGSTGWELTSDRDAYPVKGRLLNGPNAGRELVTLYPWADHANPCMVRVGKAAAGRLLDGREHSEFPESVTV